MLLVAGLAELQRPPFDMPIADSELVVGPFTEYSGLRFALFLLAEYAGIVVLSALVAVLFLGGWRGPASDVLGPAVDAAKTALVAVVVIWLRVSWPRLREDQLQRLAWGVLVPVALAQLALTTVVVVAPAERRPQAPPLATSSTPGAAHARASRRGGQEPADGAGRPLALRARPARPRAGARAGTTARALLRPATTQEYPDVEPELPPRSRGVIALVEENCTVCMLCARECPDWCIYIDSHKETLPRGRGRPGAAAERARPLRHRLLAVHVLRHLRRGLPLRRAVLEPAVRVLRARHPRPAAREGTARRLGDRRPAAPGAGSAVRRSRRRRPRPAARREGGPT